MATFEENRDRAQQLVFDSILRHSLAVERNTRGMTAEMNKVIEAAGAALGPELQERLDNLSQGELTALMRYRPGAKVDKLPTRVQGVINFIAAWSEDLRQAIGTTWQESAKEFAQAEIDFVSDLMREALEDVPVIGVTAAAVYREAMAQPVMGVFLGDALREESDKTSNRVYTTIRNGVTQGQTNAEIVRALRGTKSMNYTDGELKKTRNNLNSIVRTGRSHIAGIAQDETYRALGVEQVIFMATLDGRTCLVAGSLIDTPSGKTPIEQIKAGDLVMGGSGKPRTVRATRRARSRSLCKVTLSNGEQVVCTQDHRFWTTGGWVEAKDLRAGVALPDRL